MSNGADMIGDRLKRAVSAFVRELFPYLDFMREYTYLVASFDVVNQTADLQPAPGVTGVPTLVGIPLRTGGVNYNLTPGASVIVRFADSDPAKPYIASLDVAASSGFVPIFTGLAGATPLDAPPIGAPIARLGDTAGPWLITSGSTKVYSR